MIVLHTRAENVADELVEDFLLEPVADFLYILKNSSLCLYVNKICFKNPMRGMNFNVNSYLIDCNVCINISMHV